MVARFRFKKPSDPAIAEHLERIAREQSLPIPDGFQFLAYLQAKCGADLRGNNIRDCNDGNSSADCNGEGRRRSCLLP